MLICEILTIIFVVLKCVGTIDWPWWKVFIPEYISLVLTGGIALFWWYYFVKPMREGMKKLHEQMFGETRF